MEGLLKGNQKTKLYFIVSNLLYSKENTKILLFILKL